MDSVVNTTKLICMILASLLNSYVSVWNPAMDPEYPDTGYTTLALCATDVRLLSVAVPTTLCTRNLDAKDMDARFLFPFFAVFMSCRK